MPRRRIIWVLLAVTCLPAATMLGLGWRLLQQDRSLAAQYRQQQREQAADRAVRSLQAALAAPALLQTRPGAWAILVLYPGGPAMFRPDPPSLPEAPPELYRAAETLENTRGDLAAAAELYRQSTAAKEPAVRAGAWVRLARTLRKAHDPAGALAAYAELARIENVAAAGWPATLAAAWGRCSVLQDLGRAAELRQSARELRQQLSEGKWPLTREVYDIFAEDVERWTGEKRPLESEALTEAANGIWDRVRRGEDPGEGRRLVTIAGQPITVLWKTTGQGAAILASSRSFVEQAWLNRSGEQVWLRDESGRDLTAARSADFVLRHPSETHLPWTLAVAAPAGTDEFAARRQSLLVLLAAVGLFTLAGGYFCLRSLRREFALARIQSDFVAAVSHEFRTPLTSMRLITEALEDQRIPDADRLRDSYRALSRATGRLQRLVEDLLDFRRMESGAVEYRMRPLDAADTVRNVVDEFRREVEDRGFRVHVHVDGAARIEADESALSRAIWNLLDNAAKYSGDSQDIDVCVEHDGTRVAVSVKDRGIGIPPEERAQLFDRFYRAENAKRAGIRGTGIGLAMVAQIAAAHGGKISVTSELGRGSTFTMSLPVENA
jgi:signal transduction histidine kinase